MSRLDDLRERRRILVLELEENAREIRAELDAIHVEINDFLTARERQVLLLVQRRLTNKEIGAALNISKRTAVFHVSALLRKYKVSDRYAL